MLTSGAARSEERSTTHNSFFVSKALLFFALMDEYQYSEQVFEDDVVKFNELRYIRVFSNEAKKHRQLTDAIRTLISDERVYNFHILIILIIFIF